MPTFKLLFPVKANDFSLYFSFFVQLNVSQLIDESRLIFSNLSVSNCNVFNVKYATFGVKVKYATNYKSFGT